MALTLSVGFRGGRRHRHAREHRAPHGDGRGRRSRRPCDGSREIGFTILSMTLSLAAVFMPVLFMGGIVGRLLHEFAVTIAAAILVSGFVSLTLTPMLCSRFLRPPAEQHHGRALRRVRAGLPRPCARPTSAASTCVLRHRPAIMVALGRAPRCATVWLVRGHPQGLPAQRGHRPDLRLHRGRAGHLLRGDGRATSRRSAAIVQPGPERRRLLLERRRRRPQRRGQPGPDLHAPQAASERRSPPTR